MLWTLYIFLVLAWMMGPIFHLGWGITSSAILLVPTLLMLLWASDSRRSGRHWGYQDMGLVLMILFAFVLFSRL
jgi:hypothetical protein